MPDSFAMSGKQAVRGCLRDEPAFCTAACPFHLDVPALVTKIERKAFNAAFRAYQNAVGFPGIVSRLCDHPCQTVCIRTRVDQAVSMNLLERSLLDLATRTDPYAFNLPDKGRRIAIVGAGPAGLACALGLCRKKYDVTLFDRQKTVGGHLADRLPEAVYLADIHQQFMNETYTLVHREIRDLAPILAEFDAVFVATGTGGETFGLVPDRAKNEAVPGAAATACPGVFMGGGVTGSNTCEAIADGLSVVQVIESYLKVGRMDTPARQRSTRLKKDLSDIALCPATVPSGGTAYTGEEAVTEACRCVKCACDACLRYCDLMGHTGKSPKKVVDDVEATLHPGTLAGDGTIAKRFIASCTHCGLCRTVCPVHIDMGEFLAVSHQALVEKGAMPWAFHEFFLKDMDFSNSDRAALVRPPPGNAESCKYLFFPGCRLGASDPRYVTAAYEALLSALPNTGLMLGCCGAPARWAGEEPRLRDVLENIRRQWEALGRPALVFACPTCRQMIQRHLPDIPGTFLYPLLQDAGLTGLIGAKHPEPPPVSGMESCSPANPPENRHPMPPFEGWFEDRTVCVFDPCASREEPALQQSVRDLVTAAGYVLDPLSMEKHLAQCCSRGGQITVASPGYAREIVKSRIGQRPHPYVTYCINCRDIFASAGKPAMHILDILFTLNGPGRPPPNLTQQHNNRVRLRSLALETFWNETRDMEQTNSLNGITLHIPEPVLEDLDKKMILASDMETVVAHCETTGRKILDPETGLFTGHLKIGHMTFWALYRADKSRPDPKRFELVKGYGHRMEILEE